MINSNPESTDPSEMNISSGKSDLTDYQSNHLSTNPHHAHINHSLPPSASHHISHTTKAISVVFDESSITRTKDPRLFCATSKKKRNYLIDPLELPLPKFKIDQYWVGPMPSKEVTFANLNDNINKQFLEEMCAKFGEIHECKIYYHPKSKKHLGIAKVLFQSQHSASECCKALNNTTKMGNVMQVFLDTMGVERIKLIDNFGGPMLAGAGFGPLGPGLTIGKPVLINKSAKQPVINSNSSSPILSAGKVMNNASPAASNPATGLGLPNEIASSLSSLSGKQNEFSFHE